MKKLKKFLKISLLVLSTLILILYILFSWFTAPKSDDEVLKSFQGKKIDVKLIHTKFKDFKYRKIEVVKDSSLPTIVFVHGTIGSVMDFQSYFSDSLLSKRANMIAYDRIGYNYKDENSVQESIAFESEMLQHVIKDVPSKQLILVGYSYGGPIVLASKINTKKMILIAPAVYSKVEPMPSILQFYKWKLTRWIIPSIWKEASKEKLSHPEDLQSFEKKWNENPNQIISIHGDRDWIVPYENSKYLERILPSDQFQLVTLPEANHDLVWSRFKEIRNLILNELD